jgi:uncharacterized protein YfaS (alpha-2-macroglobulin family)
MQLKRLYSLVILVSIFLILFSCDRSKPTDKYDNPDYNPKISAFTSGLISSQASVRVMLSSDFLNDFQEEVKSEKELFEFKPAVEGSAYWIDSRTVEFRPLKNLKSATNYEVNFKLDMLFPEKKKMKDFVFSFNTIPLDLSVNINGFRSYGNTDLAWNTVEGEVRTTDYISPDIIESIVTANQSDRILKFSWDHNEVSNTHIFSVDSIERTEVNELVRINWDGKSSGLDIKGSVDYEIPALGNFIFMEHKIIQQPDQYVSIRFSDPINTNQDLRGLISLENQTNLRFSVQDNEIRVYPNTRQYGSVKLTILPGVQNILGYKYKSTQVLSLNFEELKPAVRLIGQGIIIPASEKLLFPFEAVNLKAIDVKIIRIFENNIAQFLQVNNIDGNNQIKRAGRLIAKKTINLIPERPVNFNEWNAFSLDLSDLIKTEPGAIYRVEISYRKKYSLFSCPDDEDDGNLTNENDDFENITEEDIAYWDATYDYYDYNYSYYYWDERDDPCTDSYYNYYEHKEARNVLASNLGILAKEGNDQSMLFAVTDLVTTEPLSGVELNIYNFQQQLLASLKTDGDGVASVKLDKKPYLLIASKDEQRGYLRLDGNTSLSLSQFDVSGARTENGLKGFVYGERGVWRPGDDIFLSFILEDKENSLPKEHPVTLRFSDPQGKVRQMITQTSGLNGIYHFKLSTSPDDPTGNWNANISVGGLNFYKSLRVETVKPNRLKINLDFGSDMISSSFSSPKATLSVKWLHGAVAGNLMAKVDVNFKNKTTKFKAYEDYSFSDLTKDFNPVEKNVFDGKINDLGEALITPDLELYNRSPGMVNAVFTSRVFEVGGDFSINRFSMPYSPYPVYVGMKKPEPDLYGMLVTDTLQRFDLVTVTEDGKPTAVKDLQVFVYKLDWRWWWHSGSENLASYSGSSGHIPVYSTKISSGNDGKANFSFRIDYPEWGRYLVLVKDNKGGHSTSGTVYFDWPGWAGRSARKDPQSASILPFSADKKQYYAGETAKITIPTSTEGRIFLSIENGTKVLDHYWIKATGKETSFSFTVTEEMAPNIFVNVSLIQPHAQTKNDLPIRMYGVIPITVENKNSHLYPLISMPDALAPETETEVVISEKNGKEMSYTLAIVDEGLLDLTNFKTPDPWNSFYAREALGVRTYDIYNFVLGAYGGRIDGVFSIGGGDEMDEAEPKKSANRFPPMVRFIGPFQLKAGDKNSHKIQIPNYIGSVRTMVIAAKDGAYGNSEKTCPVKKPLMMLATLPRLLSPGETVKLPVTVFAMDEKIKNVKIQVEANEFFSISEKEKSMVFNATGDKTLDFELKVNERIGVGKIKVLASSGKESAHYEIELEVRSPNPEVTQFVYGIVEENQSISKEFFLPGMKGTNKGILELSVMPPIDFGRRLKYLIKYPHGCIEQTTSAAFPQLFLSDVMETTENMNKVTTKNVNEAIKRLSNFTLSSGGFGYWPTSTREDDWGSSYAGHFLLEAKEKGYSVPENMLKNWKKYQSKTARKWSNTRYDNKWHRQSLELLQAYRLYTLAMAGEAEIGAMNRLREMPNLNQTAKWKLAAAYALAGQPETAKEMIKNLPPKTDPYDVYNYTYGSATRDAALVLETLSLLNEKEKAIPVLKMIAENLSSNSWYSTQTTAYSLLAVAKFMGKNNAGTEIDCQYKLSDTKFEKVATMHPVGQINIDFSTKSDDKIEIKNTGKGTLFYRLALSGTPLAGEEKAYAENLRMQVEYRDMSGRQLDVSRLSQGTDFIAVVTLTNTGNIGNYKDLALTQIFPSGWEIQNMRLFESSLGDYDTPTYQDIRDDRVYSYFDLSQSYSKRFVIKLTASYKGHFYLPGVKCEGMYRDDLSALVPGKWIDVVGN